MWYGGEQPLPAGGSCLLGSINIAAYVDKGAKTFDYELFQKDVIYLVKALNDVLDEGLSLHPLKIQQETVRDWRQIGLGIMGLADALIYLEIPYGDKALGFLDKLGKSFINCAVYGSAMLAKEFGAYPAYNGKAFETKFAKENLTEVTLDALKTYGLRNSQLLTIAPTGTISTLLGISGGAEPIFENSYVRRTESLHNEEKTYKVYTPVVKEYMQKHNLTDESQLPDFFVTSQHLNPLERINVQSTLQKYIDASISSTINLNESASIQDVYNIYLNAWKKGLKGVTVFRNNCKRVGILTTSETNNEPKLARGKIASVQNNLEYERIKMKTGCGSLYLFVGIDKQNNKITDIFTNTNGQGGCIINTQANSRLISLSIRAGVSIEEITRQLERAGTCPAYQYARGKGVKVSDGKSCPSAIAKVLSKIQKRLDNNQDWKTVVKKLDNVDEVVVSESIKSKDNTDTVSKGICPSCGESLTFQGGCNVCQNCGWSKCS